MGTSTVTSYVESAAGVKVGGRTGMTSLVIGIGFLLCLFFSPLATSLPKEVDAAALIYIATLFVRNITDISWDDACLLYTSPSPRDATLSRMPSSA